MCAAEIGRVIHFYCTGFPQHRSHAWYFRLQPAPKRGPVNKERCSQPFEMNDGGQLGATGVDRTWAVDSGTVGTWAYRSPIPALSANLAVADMVVVRPHTDRLDAEVDASVFRSVLPESAQVSLKSFRTSSIADVDRCQQSQLAARFACESLDVRLPSGDRRQLMPGLRRPTVQQAGTLARLVSTLNSPPEVSSPQPETRPESFQPQTAGTTLPPPATTFQP